MIQLQSNTNNNKLSGNIYIFMSQYELKHRLSTITTSAGLSNGRRLKTTAGPQFNTIQENTYTN